MTVEAVKEFGLSRKDAARAKNMFALGLLSWMYGRPTESTTAFLTKRFAKVPDIRDANITAFKSGWNFGETTETFVVRYEIKPAPMAAGHLPQHHRQPRPVLRPGRRRRAVRAADLPRVLPDHPGLRHPPRAEQAQVASASPPSRPRTRSPAIGAAIGAVLRRLARRHHHLGSRHRAEVRDHRPGRDDRAAAARHRRPARRPLDRPADQDRAGRPAAGDVRPQRRGAGADRRPAVARRLLRRRRRGRPDRGHLPHPGDAALRRLPRQRLRAVADPRRRRPARHRPGLRHRAQPRRSTARTARHRPRSSGPTCATRRPWRARGRSPAPPASSTASAASRRATVTATSPTTRPTTTSWSAPARPRSTGSPTRCRRSRSTTPAGERQGARARLGLDLRPDRRRRAAASARPATTSPRSTCATSTRSPTTSARSSSATTRCWSPR